jgi:hypothetical protein
MMKMSFGVHPIQTMVGGVMICVSLSSASALECPTLEPYGGAAGVPATLTQQLASANVLVQIPGILGQLHQQTPRAPNAEIVNYLISAYCPVVKADSRLSEQEKEAKLKGFADAVVAAQY